MKLYYVIIVLFFFGILQGTIIEVNSDGTGDYISIQAGINGSAYGDTVLVHPGIYYENVNYNDHTITLCSMNLITGERHYVFETIIDGNLEDSCIIVENSEGNGTLLCGFTLRNGVGHYGPIGTWYGGGVYTYGQYGNMLEIRNCIIEDNKAKEGAGGIYIAGLSSVYLSGTIIRNNYSSDGAGGIGLTPYSTLEFDQDNLCSIYGNYASRGCMLVRGIDIENPDTLYIFADTLSFVEPDRYFVSQGWNVSNTYVEPDEYLVVEGQHCYYDFIDADVYVSPDGDDENSGLSPQEPKKTIASAITVSVSNSENPNTVHLLPGYYSPSLNDQYFPLNMRENVSIVGVSRDQVLLDREDSWAYIHDRLSGYDYELRNMTFTGGESTGGILQVDLIFFGLTFEPTGKVIMDSLRFDSGVPALSIRATSIDFEISNIVIEDSQAEFLGYDAIPGNRSFIKNTICRNSCAGGLLFQDYMESDNLARLDVINYLSAQNYYPDIRLISYGPIIGRYVIANFINCTLMNNNSGPDGNNYMKAFGGGEINLYNTIIFGNSYCQLNLDTHGYDELSTATISHTVLEGGELGIAHQGETILNWLDGNMAMNPMLDGDYIPLDNSPVIDAGTLDLPYDIELPETDVYGNPRIYGNGVDIGAVEWQGTPVEFDDIVQKPMDIMVYPNPVISSRLRDGCAKIKYIAHEELDELRCVIYNTKGQKVKNIQKMMELDNYEYYANWDMSNNAGEQVSTGVYFIRIKNKDQYVSQRKVTVVR